MKGIYLAACKARHESYNLDYNDIDSQYGCNIVCDMFDVDLSQYDYVIATPPCNWYSIVNFYWYCSDYSFMTMGFLPRILLKLAKLGKPFIVENVRNNKRFECVGIFKLCRKYNILIKTVGRHTYFTNVDIDLECPQIQDFKYGGIRVNDDGYNQGGTNVHRVIEKWLLYVNESMFA